MELHTAPKLTPARGLFDRCEEYLERLAIDDEKRRALMVRVRGMSAKGVREAMAALHRVLADGAADSENPAYHSIDRRLELAYGTADGGRATDLATDRPQRPRLVTTPPLNRSSMVPQPWAKGWLARVLRPWGGDLIVPGASRQRLAEEARSGRAASRRPSPGHMARVRGCGVASSCSDW